MRRSLPFVVASLLVCSGFGCSGRHGRQFHSDPFASARRGRVKGAEAVDDYPLIGSPGPAAEVTPAGSDFVPKTTPARWGGLDQAAEKDSEVPSEAADSVTITVHPNSATANSKPSASARPGRIMDHAPDYSWLQGKLEYSALGGGIWKVRYAPLSADDEHGGSVILESPPDAGRFHAGDTIFVDGQIVSGTRRPGLLNPLYRAGRINRVED